MDDQKLALERQFLGRIRLISARIRSLETERSMLERLLKENMSEARKKFFKFRKNSGKRITIQSEILQILGEMERPVQAKEVYNKLLAKIPDLNSSTFRSHIKRLAETGVIEQAPGRGRYMINPSDRGT